MKNSFPFSKNQTVLSIKKKERIRRLLIADMFNSIIVSGLVLLTPLDFPHSYQVDATSPSLMSTSKSGKKWGKESGMAAPFVSKSFHTLFLTFVSLCLEVSCGARSLEGKLEKHICGFSGFRGRCAQKKVRDKHWINQSQSAPFTGGHPYTAFFI